MSKASMTASFLGEGCGSHGIVIETTNITKTILETVEICLDVSVGCGTYGSLGWVEKMGGGGGIWPWGVRDGARGETAERVSSLELVALLGVVGGRESRVRAPSKVRLSCLISCSIAADFRRPELSPLNTLVSLHAKRPTFSLQVFSHRRYSAVGGQ